MRERMPLREATFCALDDHHFFETGSPRHALLA
jgi:hypothetical protein